jgi:hypothetical protein
MTQTIPVIAIFIGGVIALTGYRLFTDVLRLWALLISGAFGAFIVTRFYPLPPGPFQFTLPLAVGFLVAGVLGVLLAHPLKGLILFLSGAMLGGLIGTEGYFLLTQREEPLLAISLVVAFGLLAIKFEDFVLIVSTAFVGAAGVVYGVLQLLNMEPIVAVIVFFATGFLGVWMQYRDAHPV